jgi:hypothetical protein
MGSKGKGGNKRKRADDAAGGDAQQHEQPPSKQPAFTTTLAGEPRPQLTPEELNPSSSSFKNKEKVLILGTRGITFRQRHLMTDLITLLPHCKKGGAGGLCASERREAWCVFISLWIHVLKHAKLNVMCLC